MDDWQILVAAVAVLLVLGIVGARGIDRWIARRTEGARESVSPTEQTRQRVRTARNVLRGLLVALLVVAAVGVGAELLDVGSGPILALALITAVFAALTGASWGSDIVAGIAVVIEGSYHEGDWIEVKPHGIVGRVENLTLRATTLRALDGTRWVLPNGEIRIAGNRTYDYSRYVVVLPVSYEDDVERAIEIVEGTYEELAGDPRFGQPATRIRVLGVDAYGSSGIDIKLFLETEPGAQWRIGREFRRRLKPALDRAGVTIPYEHREVILRSEEEARDRRRRVSTERDE